VRHTLQLLGTLALATAGTAAASDDPYSPSGAAHWNDGYRAVVIETSHGTIELASFGIAELTPRGGTALRVLHVRMAATNIDDPAPWSIDSRVVRLDIDGRSLRPLFVNSDVATLPIAVIDRGEQWVLDFYFSMPNDARTEIDESTFDFVWHVKTPGRKLESSMQFARQAGASPPDDIVLVAGWGAHWWSDPTYPWSSYHHRDGRITPRQPADVEVTRPPRLHRR
jgi:hypothetical protein